MTVLTPLASGLRCKARSTARFSVQAPCRSATRRSLARPAVFWLCPTCSSSGSSGPSTSRTRRRCPERCCNVCPDIPYQGNRRGAQTFAKKTGRAPRNDWRHGGFQARAVRRTNRQPTQSIRTRSTRTRSITASAFPRAGAVTFSDRKGCRI